jgi:N-methylhydantoinase B
MAADFLTAKEVEREYGIDLITAETIRAGLIEVTRHMFRTLKQSAFSNPVREMTDFGVCVHMVNDDFSTELVSVTEGCTHFAFTHPHMMNFMVDEWGIDNFGPGDTIVCNDPWRGSIHMPDVNLFRPVFWDGKPIFFLSDASHLVDIGGPVPGGFNTSATEVFAEGLRIPPMLITSNDKPVRSTINLILENTRTPQHNLGDLRALFGTMKVGEGRLVRLLERYGPETVQAASRYLLDLSERRMRAAIASVPDGTYEAEEWVDDDGLTEDPIRVAASATVHGSHMEIDFTGTDRQPLGSLGSCWEETNRMLVGPKVVLDPEHPMNSGMMRCFHVVAPAGSVVMAAPPTSNCQHADLAAKIADLGLRLCGQMIPDRAVAADGATTFAMPLGGIDERAGRDGQPYGGIICQGVGWGGTANNDGISFCTSPIYGISSSTIELMERDLPLLIRGTDSQIDSAGAGTYRSGFANSAMFECTDGEMVVTTLLDSGRFSRWGVAGGGEGATAYVYRVGLLRRRRCARSDHGRVVQRHRVSHKQADQLRTQRGRDAIARARRRRRLRRSSGAGS